MRRYIFILLTACCQHAAAQELFVFTEPASNMPAHSIGVRLNARYPVAHYGTFTPQRYMPEIMAGISRQLMLHTSATFSDIYSRRVRWESAKVYAKWRFYSNDDIHKHFRLAAFLEGAYSRNPFLYGELNLDGENSGIQGGLIATQLLNKLALSGTASVIKALGISGAHAEHSAHALQALNYTLSAGYLLLPRQYTGYRQTNVNVYMEMIGMKGLGKKDYNLDLAPALQVVISSNLKINAGYRFQVAGNMFRIANQNWVFGLERTFLGALQRKGK